MIGSRKARRRGQSLVEGADAQQTLQFVVWDLTLAGNNNFYFAYRRNAFTLPFGYGIVK